MSLYYYDLHVHSCLSPCGEEEMTPNNIAGMASLCGIQIMALTDHNTTKNCPAFFAACKRHGIIPFAGMELTTAEDVHVVCLFETLEEATAFDCALDAYRTPYKNKPEIFGRQLIMDEEDEIIGEEENLLINATALSLEEAYALVTEMNGVCYPAHIDREANGIIAVLGALPELPQFAAVELHDGDKREEYEQKYGLKGKKILVSSDAHSFEGMRDAANAVELADEPYSSSLVRHNFFQYLRS